MTRAIRITDAEVRAKMRRGAQCAAVLAFLNDAGAPLTPKGHKPEAGASRASRPAPRPASIFPTRKEHDDAS